MTKGEAWRWVAHHWAYGLLRWAVLTIEGLDMVSTASKAARGPRRIRGSIPRRSTP